MKPSKKIGILGAGSWGTTLAYLISKNNHSVWLWSQNSKITQEINYNHTNQKYIHGLKLSKQVQATQDIQKVMKNCQLIFLALPSSVFREVIHESRSNITKQHLLISGTKGIENKTFYTMSDILREETSCSKIAVLSGPNIAADILRGDPTGAIAACDQEEVIDQVMDILGQPLFKLYASKDVKGVEMAGALKNIIAIAAGIADGLKFGNNSKGFLITRGMVEISRYGKFFGAQSHTFFGLAGIGDLITTCYSEDSRNHTLGKQLALGRKKEAILKSIGMTVEGIATAQAVYAVSQKKNIYMPITTGIYRLLFENADLQKVIQELMTVRSKYEDED